MKEYNNISGVTCDSRKVGAGDAFVAIEGFEDDGNKYIDDAVKQGAEVVYTEREIDHREVQVVKVDNARKILAQLANQVYNSPSESLELVGVTGTNGKTTTTHLIEKLFSGYGFTTGLIGTVKIKLGDKVEEADLTTPGADQICNYMDKMVDNNVDIAAMEVSSHGIKLHRVEGLDFDIVVYTNLTKDHLDLHEDFEDYLATKKELFKQAGEESTALINLDDEYADRIMSGLSAEVITYGFSDRADIQVTEASYDAGGSRFRIESSLASPQQFEIELNLLGRHNIYNALAAAAVGLIYGLSVEEIKAQLKEFNPFFRRLEVIYDDKFTIIDDCAHNPGNYRAVFETIKELDYDRLYIINAIRGNRGITVSRENAEIISKYIPDLNLSKLYITSCEKLANKYDVVSDEEREVFLSTLCDSGLEFEYFDYLHPCLNQTLKQVKSNDLIILLGAHAMDQAADLILNLINNNN
ncbi:Mur ligase family protein [Acetohalobium arabaticum]|uniref:UDP-N-acetylmuramyl-tripeptide synthetase n=1 Tax=Acetohalobium arabaticum (strain ATCC 49924 / DSM 5501 / Z-7288) TaxID=574087 RepID=D9QQ08_ACEAZ|nr:UDP-N-acetylmuramyl-tripeptide synthetase [Acetohalobium arabaticum]ADL12599.1 UDP-N-acetylmuramyl-tripeptide synthetase [Acetohalobium arabaticum DSM 5501]